MKEIILQLTDTEYRALGTEAHDVHHFLENFAKERARLAKDAIVKSIITEKMKNGENISGTKEEIFEAANVLTLADIEPKAEQ